MLPTTCSQPPCRNMLVKTDSHEKAAGTAPNRQERSSSRPQLPLVEEGERVDGDEPEVTTGVCAKE